MSLHGVEEQAHAAWNTESYERAAALVIEGYGPELLGFLVAQLHDQVRAEEVFSEFCEDFWKGLPQFQWRCSIRTWCYAVLRNSLHRQQRAEHRQRVRQKPLDTDGLAQVIDRARTETRPYLKTQTKVAIRRLRERLTDDERALLILRVDRNMSWNDLAHVWFGHDAHPTAAQLHAEAAKLRKRFERVKQKLRMMAEEEGLLPRNFKETTFDCAGKD